MRLRHLLLFLLRRSAQAMNLSIDVVRRTILAPFIITGMAFYPEYFDRDYYRSQPGAGYFRRTFPFLHFVMHGAWTLQDPHPRYSQRDILRNHPSLNWPPYVNSVLSWRLRLDHSIVEVVDPAPPEPTVVMPRTPTRLEALWPRIELDAAGLSDSVSSITPTAHVKRHVLATQRARPVASEGSRAVVKLLDQLHDEVDFLFVAPWLGIRGGGERSTERYFSVLAAHYPENRIAILLPDNVQVPRSPRTRESVPRAMGCEILEMRFEQANHSGRQRKVEGALRRVSQARARERRAIVGEADQPLVEGGVPQRGEKKAIVNIQPLLVSALGPWLDMRGAEERSFGDSG